MGDDLVRRLRALARRRRGRLLPAPAADPPPGSQVELLGERVRALEAEVAEVRGRVNGLLFLVAGTVLTQVLLRLVS